METDRAEALELSKGLSPSASNIERIANRTTPEAARWAFTQWDLRSRAAKKGFPKAIKMLFTREALEQATHFEVARYHASLFPAGVLVADLTCGIGSDLIAFAERGPVVGFDTDQERLAYARHNLEVHGLSGELILGSCLTTGPDENEHSGHGLREWNFDYAFADPSRRVKGARTLDLACFSPKASLLSERMRSLKLGLIKLSPLIPNEKLFGLGHQLEFVSFYAECREALVYCNFESYRETYAVRVESRSRVKGIGRRSYTEQPLDFVYQFDPAAARADAVDSILRGLVGIDHSFVGLGTAKAYVTTREPLPGSEWILAGFRVLDSGKGVAVKQIRKKMQELGCGRAVVKGDVGFDVSDFAKKLRGSGEREATIILYKRKQSMSHAFVERL